MHTEGDKIVKHYEDPKNRKRQANATRAYYARIKVTA
jgi:hypothetical protein